VWRCVYRAGDARTNSLVLSDESINRIGAGDWTALAGTPTRIGV
jgi:hypothetical protein